MDGTLGTIMIFAGNFAPRGWALCNGQLLSIAQNTALFSILGTTYGGDGRVTFGLPDLRGRAPIGAGQGPGLANITLGEAAGSENVTLLSSQMPAHTHLVAASQSANATSPANAFPSNDSRDALNIYAGTSDGTTMNPQMIGTAGGNQPVGTRNPFLGINYIICTEGIFPSRN